MIRPKARAALRLLLLATGVLAALAPALLSEQSAPRRNRTSRGRPAARPEPLKTKRAPEGSGFVGEPISLDLKDADIKDVLRTFAELRKLNIAIDPDVKGSVTLRLHDVPWDQALDVILRINGLGYVLEGNILRVGTPARLLSRIDD
jgi:type II secretory pathway component HofQ